MQITKILTIAIMLPALAACGNTKNERALSGGALGAGAGAVGTAVLGGSVLTGAVIGGAVGAATGALTDKNDLNLGNIN